MRLTTLSIILSATLASSIPLAAHADAVEETSTLSTAFEGVAMPDSAMTDERGGGIFAVMPKGSTTRIDINDASSGTNNQPGNPSHSKTVLANGGTKASAEASLSNTGPATNFNLSSVLGFNSNVSTTRSFSFSQVTGQ
jgi:hypothetical protein